MLARALNILLPQKSVVVADCFYIAQISSLEQTRWTLVTCDSKLVTSFSWRIFEYIPKQCTYSAVWLLHGWCHMKLLLSKHILCMPCNHVTSLHVGLLQVGVHHHYVVLGFAAAGQAKGRLPRSGVLCGNGHETQKVSAFCDTGQCQKCPSFLYVDCFYIRNEWTTAGEADKIEQL